MRRGLPTLLLCVALLAGCKRQDMWTQGSVRNWDRSQFFANGSSMRLPVAGTVARNPTDPDVPQPAVIDATMMARGAERFGIFCTPCHGRVGNGEGMIVQRGFTHPPSFVDGALLHADAGVFYDAITNGYGAMYSFRTRVPSADRWAIIAYIRALQLSQNADPARLSPADRAQLGAATP